jgi:hypothetical protein
MTLANRMTFERPVREQKILEGLVIFQLKNLITASEILDTYTIRFCKPSSDISTS